MTRLTDARLKIEWAHKHIADLARALEEFAKSDFHSVSVHPDESGAQCLRAHARALPSACALLLGDAIHNLRSALDLALWQIVEARGHAPGRFLRLPFDRSRDQLVATIKGGEVKAAGERVCDAIVDRVKPYHGGNHALCALNELDIADKHKRIIPIVRVVQIDGIDVISDSVLITSLATQFDRNGTGDLVGLQGNVYVVHKGKATCAVLFPEGTPLEGQPVLPTLVQLGQATVEAVQALEEAASA